MSRWVQHVSGQGQTWELLDDGGYYTWNVKDPEVGQLFLPKADYRPCEPPEAGQAGDEALHQACLLLMRVPGLLNLLDDEARQLRDEIDQFLLTRQRAQRDRL